MCCVYIFSEIWQLIILPFFHNHSNMNEVVGCRKSRPKGFINSNVENIMIPLIFVFAKAFGIFAERCMYICHFKWSVLNCLHYAPSIVICSCKFLFLCISNRNDLNKTERDKKKHERPRQMRVRPKQTNANVYL